MWEHLDQNKKLDNFDKDSQHAMVKCSSKTRNFHGSTVMLVQTSSTLISPPSQSARIQADDLTTCNELQSSSSSSSEEIPPSAKP